VEGCALQVKTLTWRCSAHVTSRPCHSRSDSVSGSEIRKHAIMGYYGFQDYAAAFWWKHAHRVTDTATDIDTDLYNRTLQAVAKAMEAYSNSNNSVPEPGGYPTDAVQRRLKELAKDAHEWENNFKIEFRTRAIGNIIEVLSSEEGASETSILTLHGAVRYKCSKPWCQSFYRGFERREDRDQHLLEHDRPFRCSVEGCYGNEIGFPSESDLSRHTERLHLTQSTIHFALPRPSKSEHQVICSAAATGDLAKVKACLLAGIPIDTKTTNKGGKTPLYLAAEKGHIHICQYLLERGTDVNFQGDRGLKRTALHVAALADDLELTHLLLSQPNTTPQLKAKDFFTAAGSAAKNGCNKALSIFISRGLASQPSQDAAGRTCLSIAMDFGNLETAELLINDASLDLNEDYERKYQSELPLHIAARTGAVEILKLLLSSGRVDVNKADLSGQRALHQACKKGRYSIVELLLPVIDGHNARDNSGTTPFQYAAKKEHWAVVKLLLESGKVDADSKDDDGRTLLLWATQNRHAEVAKLLLEKGADPNSKDGDSRSPLLWATQNRHAEVAKLLLEKGAIQTSRDNYGWTPLWRATENWHAEVIKLLLERGADLNLMDDDSRILLLWATRNRHAEVAKLVLEKGADLNPKNGDSKSPLLWATQNGHAELAKLLLEKGANSTSRDNYGWTPLLWAAQNGHAEVAKLLLEKGADPNSKDSVGRTPLLWATHNGHAEVIKLLLEKGANSGSKGI
jgi:ankyrin repeat protein